MDGNMISSLMGTSSTSESKPKRTDAPDGDAFSKVMDEAGGKSHSKSGKDLVDEKSDKDTDKKEEKKKQAKAEHEEFLRTTGQASEQMPPHLRKMMHVNLDVLSMAERQSLRVGEFSNDAVAKQAQQQYQQEAKKQPTPQKSNAAEAKLNQMSLGQTPAPVQAANERPEVVQERKPTEKDAAEFEKISKEVAGEKGPVNLEKMMEQEAKALEQTNKAGAAERAQQRQSLMDQIMTQIEVRNLANKTELHLRLNPEYLGELKLNLVHSPDGIKAEFMTTSRVTRDLLAEGQDELKDMAKGKGIRLGTVNFRVVDRLDSTGTAG